MTIALWARDFDTSRTGMRLLGTKWRGLLTLVTLLPLSVDFVDRLGLPLGILLFKLKRFISPDVVLLTTESILMMIIYKKIK